VSDVTDAGRQLASELGAAWVEPSDALDVDADVLAPCALGGYIDSEAVARLRVPAIAGAANNQLSDDTVADLLTERGILWAPDFVVNAGGLIAVAAEHRARSLDSGPLAFDRAAALRAIEAIGGTLGEVYRRAEAAGTSTLVAAQELAVERAAAAAAGRQLAA
jgi:leucine dehydrogenase